MNKIVVAIFSLVLLLILIGCNVTTDNSENQFNIPTSGGLITPDFNRLPSPTTTQTQKPTLTIIQTPESTLTTISTATPTPNYLPAVQTHAYWMHTEVPATLEARRVHCKNGFVLELELEILRHSNDEWTIFTCSPLPENREEKWTPGIVNYGTRYTQITKNDLSQTWTIQHNQFDYSRIDRPDAYLTPYRWTQDGKFLYLFPHYYPFGSGFPKSSRLRTHLSDLYRINLETGDFELVLKRDQFCSLALSPNNQFLVYSQLDDPEIIHVKNMDSGNDLQVNLNEDIIASGPFIWNPENTKIVFAIGYGKESDDWQDDVSGTSIIALTLKNMHAQTILLKDTRMFVPWKCEDGYWVDKNTICLISLNGESNMRDSIFTVNIQTGHVMEVTIPTKESGATSTLAPQP